MNFVLGRFAFKSGSVEGIYIQLWKGNIQQHVNFQRQWVGRASSVQRPGFRAEHYDGDIQGTSKLNQISRFKVGAVTETTATGGVGVLRDTIDEYFPLGVGVGNIDKVVERIESANYKNMCEFHNRGRGQTTYGWH